MSTDDIQELRVDFGSVTGIYMGQRFAYSFEEPFYSHAETAACFIRDAWLKQQLTLEPMRQSSGWIALCDGISHDLSENDRDRVERWIAEHLTKEFPDLPISADLVLTLARSHRAARSYVRRQDMMRIHAYYGIPGYQPLPAKRYQPENPDPPALPQKSRKRKAPKDVPWSYGATL